MLSLLYHRQIPAKLPNNVKNIIWLVGCYLSKEETTNSQPTFLLWCVLTGSKAKGTGPDAEIKPLKLFPNCTANQRENNEKETKKKCKDKRMWGRGSGALVWWSWVCLELTLHVRRRVQTFFLSGSRTPQCLSKSHSLSEDTERASQLHHHTVNEITKPSISLYTYGV